MKKAYGLGCSRILGTIELKSTTVYSLASTNEFIIIINQTYLANWRLSYPKKLTE